jgi:hypothetical protein
MYFEGVHHNSLFMHMYLPPQVHTSRNRNFPRVTDICTEILSFGQPVENASGLHLEVRVYALDNLFDAVPEWQLEEIYRVRSFTGG